MVNPTSPTILIVDDDPDIREALQDVLADYGYSARTAGNGREALDLLREGPRPRLILLDLMMPVMDGIQFRAAQLADAMLADLPVLVISAGNELERSARALAVTDWLRKPLDLDKLLAVVARTHGEQPPTTHEK